MSAIISFLSGSVFRMIWGEISHFITAREEHKQEIARLELQERVDAAAHTRNLEAIRLKADLGVKEIEAQSDAAQALEELKAWAVAVSDVGKRTGVPWIDAWNAAIRPAIATWAVVAITLSEFGMITLSVLAADVACAALGIFLADRTLVKRGK